MPSSPGADVPFNSAHASSMMSGLSSKLDNNRPDGAGSSTEKNCLKFGIFHSGLGRVKILLYC